MRIITGSAKGLNIKVPNIPEIRPAQDIVRQAVFNILGDSVKKKITLDLFAGSGSYGLEALSRGASWCDFVDIDPRAVHILTQNLQKLGLTEKAEVYKVDAQKFIGNTPNVYDIVFLSPYYNEGLVTHIIKSLDLVLNKKGLVFYDHKRDLTVPRSFEGLDGNKVKVIDTRAFGETSVSILTKEDS